MERKRFTYCSFGHSQTCIRHLQWMTIDRKYVALAVIQKNYAENLLATSTGSN